MAAPVRPRAGTAVLQFPCRSKKRLSDTQVDAVVAVRASGAGDDGAQLALVHAMLFDIPRDVPAASHSAVQHRQNMLHGQQDATAADELNNILCQADRITDVHSANYVSSTP